MRKPLLLLLASAMIAPATIQAQDDEVLTQKDFGRISMVTYALGGGYIFNYQEGFNTLESVDEVFPGFENVTRKFFYNDRGLVTKEEAWQHKSNGTESMSNFAEMEYNSKGQLIVRRGYNIAAWGDLTLANTRDYTYDEEGRLTTLEVYLGDRSSIYETYAYLYGPNGKLEVLDRSMPDDKTGKLLVNERTTYYYDANGRITKRVNEQFYYDRCETYEYAYDEVGNIKQITQIDKEGNETGIDEYTYFEGFDNADVIYPNIPSNSYISSIRDMGIASVNPMETMATIRIVPDSDVDPYTEDMITFMYEPADWSGINNMFADPINDFGVMTFITGNNMRLDGVALGSNVRIYNMAGAKLYDGVYNGCIDLTNIPRGIYTIATNNGATKFAR